MFGIHPPPIKNERLFQHIADCDRRLDTVRYHELRVRDHDHYQSPETAAWAQKHPEIIVFEFYNTFMKKSSHLNYNMGTAPVYEYVWFWPEVFPYVFHNMRDYCDCKTSLDFTAKMLAAMLSYLAVNEHGFWFRYTCYRDKIQAGKGPHRPLWANMHTAEVGRKDKYVDFLPYCKRAIKKGTPDKPEGLRMELDEVVAKYKRLTGVDLREYGLRDI